VGTGLHTGWGTNEKRSTAMEEEQDWENVARREQAEEGPAWFAGLSRGRR